MNFLSHFYFDRFAPNSHLVLGVVLPDLLKNAHKDWKPHPQKHEELFQHPDHLAILSGWKRHLAVDKHFHGSAFFQQHTQAIKSLIAPYLHQSAVWPSFLAHISLELMLDSLLLTEEWIQVDDFYTHLAQTDRTSIKSFLQINQISDTEPFFEFFDRFLQSRYLNSYRDSHQIVYALNRICMRLWPQGLQEANQTQIEQSLLSYRAVLQQDFGSIFKAIEMQLD